MPGKKNQFLGAFRGKRSVNAKQNKEIKTLKKKVSAIEKTITKKFKDSSIPDTLLSNPVLGEYQFDIAALSAWDSNALNANEIRTRQREGNSVVVKQVLVKGEIILPNDQGTLTPLYNSKVRCLIVRSPDSGYPLIDQILEDPNDIFSHKKIKPENPYKVLYDRSFNLSNITQVRGAATTGVNTTSTEPFRIPLNIRLGKKALGKEGAKATWQQGTTSIHPQQGAITLFMYSDVSDTLQAKPVFTGRVRLRFLE